MTNLLLNLAAALAAATCALSDQGMPHEQAFEAILNANAATIMRLVKTDQDAAVLGTNARIMAEQLCPHNFLPLI